MQPPASSAATQRSCDIDKVRFFRKYFHIVFPPLFRCQLLQAPQSQQRPKSQITSAATARLAVQIETLINLDFVLE